MFSFFAMNLPLGNVIWDTFWVSDGLGQLIVIGLLLVSLVVWAIMVNKWRELRRASFSDQQFLSKFREQMHPFALYMDGRTRALFRYSPLARVYEAACDAAKREFEVAASRRGEPAAEINLSKVRLKAEQIDSIRKAGECMAADQILLMEEQMSFLASSYTIAPMLGLFGTVWGVMLTFNAMGGDGMANLGSVAPGISSAMLTTIVGLFVAIPTAFGSNRLNQEIRFSAIQMDNFMDKFAAQLLQYFLHD